MNTNNRKTSPSKAQHSPDLFAAGTKMHKLLWFKQLQLNGVRIRSQSDFDTWYESNFQLQSKPVVSARASKMRGKTATKPSKSRSKAKDELVQKIEVKIGYEESKKKKSTGCLFGATKLKKKSSTSEVDIEAEHERLALQLARTKKMIQELKEENERLMNQWFKSNNDKFAKL